LNTAIGTASSAWRRWISSAAVVIVLMRPPIPPSEAEAPGPSSRPGLSWLLRSLLDVTATHWSYAVRTGTQPSIVSPMLNPREPPSYGATPAAWAFVRARVRWRT
jgi:hypothetical protein